MRQSKHYRFITIITLTFICGSVLLGHQVKAKPFYDKSLTLIKVFGQSHYTQGSRNTVSATNIYHGAGVKVDKSTTPNRIYVVDTGNSRILGFASLGTCQRSAKACTNDLDCSTGEACLISGTKPADIVIGQPDFNQGACNHDVNTGVFKPAGPDSLCLMNYPIAANIAESWMRINIDVDQNGNLYVPDTYNNRVLIYKNPFSPQKTGGAGDNVADFVIGQPNFSDHQPNQGRDNPDQTSLRLDYSWQGVMSRGVSVDKYGSVWVADSMNRRVLRFSLTEIESARSQNRAPRADLVLGQPDFSSSSSKGCQVPLDQQPDPHFLCAPTLAKLHPVTGELYVLDETIRSHPQATGGLPFQTSIIVFKPDQNGRFRSGQPYDRIITVRQPLPYETDSNWPIDYFLQATTLEFNLPNNGYYQDGYQEGFMWLTEHKGRRVLLIDHEGNIVKIIGAPSEKVYDPYFRGLRYRAGWRWDFCSTTGYCLWPGGSLGFDNMGNIYLTDEVSHRVLRFKLPYKVKVSADKRTITLPSPNAFIIQPRRGMLDPNSITSYGFDMTNGLAAHGNQLIIRDKNRFMVWNNYLSNQWRGSFIVGQPHPNTREADYLSIGRAGALLVIDDKLWSVNTRGLLSVYSLPLKPQSHNGITESQDQISNSQSGDVTNTVRKIPLFSINLKDKNGSHVKAVITGYDSCNNTAFINGTNDNGWVNVGNGMIRCSRDQGNVVTIKLIIVPDGTYQFYSVYLDIDMVRSNIYEVTIDDLDLSDKSKQIITNLSLKWADDNAYVAYQASLGLAYSQKLDSLFVADTKNHRVLVIKDPTNIVNNSLTVSMVIGQPDKQHTKCNHDQPDQWLAPGAAKPNSLCLPVSLALDPYDNLYVVENTYEGHGNNRISVWSYQDIANALNRGELFPNISAVKVFTQPSLNAKPEPRKYPDRPSSPTSLAFDKYGRLVIANDGSYMGYGNNQFSNLRPFRQLWFYDNPLAKDSQGRYIQNQPADAYIDVPVGVPGGVTFDSWNNLIIHDGTWSRVMVVNLDCDPELVKPVSDNFVYQPKECLLKPSDPADVNNNQVAVDKGDIICFIYQYFTRSSAKLSSTVGLFYDINQDGRFNRHDLLSAIIRYLKNPRIVSGTGCQPVVTE